MKCKVIVKILTLVYKSNTEERQWTKRSATKDVEMWIQQ